VKNSKSSYELIAFCGGEVRTQDAYLCECKL